MTQAGRPRRDTIIVRYDSRHDLRSVARTFNQLESLTAAANEFVRSLGETTEPANPDIELVNLGSVEVWLSVITSALPGAIIVQSLILGRDWTFKRRRLLQDIEERKIANQQAQIQTARDQSRLDFERTLQRRVLRGRPLTPDQRQILHGLIGLAQAAPIAELSGPSIGPIPSDPGTPQGPDIGPSF